MEKKMFLYPLNEKTLCFHSDDLLAWIVQVESWSALDPLIKNSDWAFGAVDSGLSQIGSAEKWTQLYYDSEMLNAKYVTSMESWTARIFSTTPTGPYDGCIEHSDDIRYMYIFLVRQWT